MSWYSGSRKELWVGPMEESLVIEISDPVGYILMVGIGSSVLVEPIT